MTNCEDKEIDQNLEMAASFFTYEISDDALEAAAGSILMSGSSNPGVNCTGGCKR